jgi:hypothetical protein
MNFACADSMHFQNPQILKNQIKKLQGSENRGKIEKIKFKKLIEFLRISLEIILNDYPGLGHSEPHP